MKKAKPQSCILKVTIAAGAVLTISLLATRSFSRSATSPNHWPFASASDELESRSSSKDLVPVSEVDLQELSFDANLSSGASQRKKKKEKDSESEMGLEADEPAKRGSRDDGEKIGSTPDKERKGEEEEEAPQDRRHTDYNFQSQQDKREEKRDRSESFEGLNKRSSQDTATETSLVRRGESDPRCMMESRREHIEQICDVIGCTSSGGYCSYKEGMEWCWLNRPYKIDGRSAKVDKCAFCACTVTMSAKCRGPCYYHRGVEKLRSPDSPRIVESSETVDLPNSFDCLTISKSPRKKECMGRDAHGKEQQPKTLPKEGKVRQNLNHIVGEEKEKKDQGRSKQTYAGETRFGEKGIDRESTQRRPVFVDLTRKDSEEKDPSKRLRAQNARASSKYRQKQRIEKATREKLGLGPSEVEQRAYQKRRIRDERKKRERKLRKMEGEKTENEQSKPRTEKPSPSKDTNEESQWPNWWRYGLT